MTESLFEKENETSIDSLKAIFEAVLFVSKRPVTVRDLRRVLPEGRRMRESEIAAILEEIKIEYIKSRRSFRIVEIAGGYQLRTSPDFAPYIAKYFQLNKAEHLSQPALETLAVIAYRQPITRAVIEGIRGVDSSGVTKSLYEKGLIKIVGRQEVPGRPFLYSTTEKFLEYFGLKGIDDLPHRRELSDLDLKQETMDFNPKKRDEEEKDNETEAGQGEEEGIGETSSGPEGESQQG